MPFLSILLMVAVLKHNVISLHVTTVYGGDECAWWWWWWQRYYVTCESFLLRLRHVGAYPAWRVAWMHVTTNQHGDNWACVVCYYHQYCRRRRRRRPSPWKNRQTRPSTAMDVILMDGFDGRAIAWMHLFFSLNCKQH